MTAETTLGVLDAFDVNTGAGIVVAPATIAIVFIIELDTVGANPLAAPETTAGVTTAGMLASAETAVTAATADVVTTLSVCSTGVGTVTLQPTTTVVIFVDSAATMVGAGTVVIPATTTRETVALVAATIVGAGTVTVPATTAGVAEAFDVIVTAGIVVTPATTVPVIIVELETVGAKPLAVPATTAGVIATGMVAEPVIVELAATTGGVTTLLI